MTAPTGGDDGATRQLPRSAGLGCGLVYGLAYGLIVWGTDAYVLARSNAELAGAKLALGLPLLLLIGAVTGTLAGRSDRAGAWVGAWTASGALIGGAVTLMPTVGLNLAAWITEPRLRGANVYPMGPGGAARTVFVTVVNVCVGPAVGLVGYLLAERARHLAAPTGRMSARSWAVLALCLSLALPPGLLGDELVNKPLRIGQRIVHETISADLAGGLGEGDVDPDRDLLSDSFTLHLVGHDLEEPGQTTIDAAFDSGLIVRCELSGRTLNGCPPVSPHFEAWMDALIQEGLRGGSGSELERQAGRVSVDENTLRWLASQGEHMSGRYEISIDIQRGGWVIMSARFDSGYVLVCHFRGASPVVVDHCSGNQQTRR